MELKQSVRTELIQTLSAAPKWFPDVETVKALLILIHVHVHVWLRCSCNCLCIICFCKITFLMLFHETSVSPHACINATCAEIYSYVQGAQYFMS